MHPLIQPYSTFKTSDNKHIVIGAATENQFQKLCQILGMNELSTNPSFLSNALRVKNKHELRDILNRLVVNFTLADLMVQLK
jgi:crotonobetainyl-CoA:carnitine CoA-transferase CaiB-like acyl-CoA transferase